MKVYNDHSKADEEVEMKAPEAIAVMEEKPEGHRRRGQDGGTLLQWGQRKRSSGLLKRSIRADRRVVVGADKQVAAPPASQPRGNVLRPSNGPLLEAASGAAKRTSDVSASAALCGEYDLIQLSNGPQPQSGDQEESRSQRPDLPSNSEKALVSNSGSHTVTVVAALSLRRADAGSFSEKSVALEKMSLGLFEWPKIETSLTRREKEDDFTAIRGTKLPQRLKRRPKVVEKHVQFINPGTWLCDLTRERYEVREKKAVKKRPRGLKAMGGVDSDSE